MNPKRIGRRPTFEWTHERVQLLKDLVASGTVQLQEIPKILGTSRSIVRKKIAKLQLQTTFQQRMRKYRLDIEFFTIPSRNLYYVVGLLGADGNICKGHVSLSLKGEDKEHLERVVRLYSDHPIYQRKDTGHCNWDVYSRELCEILSDRFGIEPRKSFTLPFPSDIPNQYLGDYLRGYFDGNGSISIMNRRTLRFAIATASYCFADGLRNALRGVNIESTLDKQLGKSAMTVWMRTGASEQFADLIYQDPCLYLPRKRAVLEEFKQIPIYFLPKEVAHIFGIPVWKLRNIQKSLNLPYTYEDERGKWYSDDDITAWRAALA